MAVRPPAHHTTSQAVAQTLEIYDRDARLFLTRWGKPRYKRPALLVEWLTLLPARAVLLDLGCGAGQDTRYLATLGNRALGLDRTLPLVRFGRSRVPGVPLIRADTRYIPVHTGSLDGIWAAAALMHLPKATVTDVLRRLRGLVRPGGLLAGTVTYGTRSRILRRGWIPGRYVARWRRSVLAGALRRAGWKILKLRVVSNQERKGRWINLIV